MIKTHIIFVIALLLLLSSCSICKPNACVGSTVKGCQPILYFDFNKADIRSNELEQAQWIANKFNRWPNSYIMLTGHADIVGSDDYNNQLSKKRAENVSDYLKSKGVNPEHIKVLYKGKTELLTTNLEKQEINRRVIVIIDRK